MPTLNTNSTNSQSPETGVKPFYMPKWLQWIIRSLGVVVSLYLQSVESQVIIVALIFFLVFFFGRVIENSITHKKESWGETLKNDPVVRAFGLFVCGAFLCWAFTWIRGINENRERKRIQEQNRELFVDNLALSAISDICLMELDAEQVVPDVDWFIENGIDSSKYNIDYLLGDYYSEHLVFDEARRYYQKASNRCPLAEFKYGLAVYFGFADMPEKDDGLDIIRSAAEKQVDEAIWFLFAQGIISKNPRDVMKWYEAYLNAFTAASDPEIKLTFRNNKLYDKQDKDPDKHKRAESILKRRVQQLSESSCDMLNLIVSFYVESGNPSDAFKAYKTFLSFLEPKGSDSDLLEAMEYEIMTRSGNVSKAKIKEHERNKKRYSSEDMKKKLRVEYTKHLLFSYEIKD